MKSNSFRYALACCFVATGFILVASSCTQPMSAEAIKLRQYYVQGEQLYGKHCSNCHQKSGKGLALVYPPVDSSDYLDAHFDEIVCQMKYGRKGEMTVNGQNFNQPMPGVRSLTALEIAEIATYLYNSWGREKGLVEVVAVTQALDKCRPD